MKIVLLGATGYLGSHVAEQLILAGFDVQCLVRQDSDVSFLQKINANICTVNFKNLSSLAIYIHENSTVINCIADTRAHVSYQQKQGIEIELTQQLFKLAQNNHAKRFIQLSTVMVYGFDRPTTAIDENFEKSLGYTYNQIAVDKEAGLLREFKLDSTELIILRPSNTIGQRDTSFLPPLLLAHKFKLFPVVGNGLWQFSCIDARDVGRSMVHLLNVTVGKPEIFLVKGFDTDWQLFKQTLDGVLVRRSLKLTLPKSMMMMFAKLVETLYPYGSNPPLTQFDVEVISTDTLFDDSKIRATGFDPKYNLLAAFESVILQKSNKKGADKHL